MRWDRRLAQCRVGVCSVLRGYVGRAGDARCRNCCEGVVENVEHFWDDCPKWAKERAGRGDLTRMVDSPESALGFIKNTFFRCFY